jgi:hypothetical protein
MIVSGGGGGNVGDGGGGVGGDGRGAESIDPARKETRSGKELKHTDAHVTPRPSQSKTGLPLCGDWMVHFCTKVCTILTIRSWRALLASLDSSMLVCIAGEVATVDLAPEM